MIDVQAERRVKRELDYLIPLYDVKKMLGLSWPKMMYLVKSGQLPVISASGEKLSLDDIDEDTRGLRVLPTDLQAFISL